MAKVLVADKLSAEGLAALRRYDGLEVVVAEGQPRAKILELVAEADALVVRSETQVDAELISRAPKLKAVGRAGVGVDNIDIPAATSRGIVVMNAPEGNTIATCELACAHLINSFRPLAAAVASMKTGAWDKKNFVGTELYGKTLGILGLGRIGAQVAKRALAFGMKVLAYDPYLSPDRAQALGVAKTTLESIAQEADAISLHMPLTSSTTRMIGEDFLAKAKKGLRVINCARGELVDEAALLKALDDGRVAYAGLDVFCEEPLPENHPFRKHTKVSLTPHLGASTKEAQASVGLEIAESIAGLLLRGQIRNAINAPSISLEDITRLTPALDLSKRLARLLQAFCGENLQSLSLTANFARGDIPALSRSAMTGFLASISGASVNDINAPAILESRGIAFESTHSTALSDYSESLALCARSGSATLAAEGALLGRTRSPRLTSFKSVRVELPLSGRPLLIVENKDEPGVVGLVGTVLSSAKVNIANMTLGRTGQTALTILELDSAPSAEVIATLKKNPSILSATVVTF